MSKIVKNKLKVKLTLKQVQLLSGVIRPIPGVHKFDANKEGIRYWLVKSEPLKRIDSKTGKDVSYPLSELLKTDKESWDGVRNYEARNSMLQMSIGDIALFYHSNCPNPGIVGVVTVVGEARPDDSQFDATRQYFDPKSTTEKPRWWCVDVAFKRRLRHKISLVELKLNPKLQEFLLVKRGRLSVIPVRETEFEEIMLMEITGEVKDDIDCDIDQKYIKPKKETPT